MKNVSVMKNKNNEFFSRKKTPRKITMDLSNGETDSSLILLLSPSHITPSDGSCYKLIDSSIQQEIFYFTRNINHAN